MAAPSHLIVGLGNPGDDYAGTRHNVGFDVLDLIAHRYGSGGWKKKFRGLIQPATIDDEDVLLLKPETYMNLSGESAVEALAFYKLEPKNVTVFHDDLDLQIGQVKVKQGGGTGGHNGLKSLDAHIGLNYWRVRIGIGHPGEKGEAVTNHVLGPFAKADKAIIEPLLEKLADNVDVLLAGDREKYLSSLIEQ